ncbi:MAG TPA: undecaprenyldiphospho-muramoylpentapeptide beta-N-acetylglucosaminyltransferase [Actinomycetota bacterium]|nr:undecaprenyldiphospho-muramoylpentapeptide beta-N-acetylglucosaminyltransferase [Actinomycetota bacterium]
MRVVIAGGGTAGHVAPGLALGRELARRGHEVAFVGTDRGLEARLVPAAGFELHLLPTVPFVRKVSPAALRAPAAALRAVGRCRTVVRGAGAVVGMGGYASVPAVLAAWRERIPRVLHEQNAAPGLANRALSRLATVVALSFPDAGPRFPRRVRQTLTGNPVREAILHARRDRAALADAARTEFDLAVDRRTVVVFGGSQGALRVDRAVLGAAPRLGSLGAGLQFVLITGPAHLGSMRAEAPPPRDGPVVRLLGFVDRMELAYAVADLVIARGGASTVAEVSACGVPSILIPYPHAIAGEQEANARALERAGGAVVMRDADVTPETLAARIASLVWDDDRLGAMADRAAAFGRPDAASRLAALVEEVASR